MALAICEKPGGEVKGMGWKVNLTFKERDFIHLHDTHRVSPHFSSLHFFLSFHLFIIAITTTTTPGTGKQHYTCSSGFSPSPFSISILFLARLTAGVHQGSMHAKQCIKEFDNIWYLTVKGFSSPATPRLPFCPYLDKPTNKALVLPPLVPAGGSNYLSFSLRARALALSPPANHHKNWVNLLSQFSQAIFKPAWEPPLLSPEILIMMSNKLFNYPWCLGGVTNWDMETKFWVGRSYYYRVATTNGTENARPFLHYGDLDN